MVRIGSVTPGSIAESLELQIGTRIVTVNGERVRDGLDFLFLTGDGDLELEAVDPQGNPVVYEIERDPEEALGIVPAQDKIRECANECVFCFIDGNPPGARPPLWVRDDDFRLSFTYGSYVTLTNLGPKGLQRLVDQRITPLYVSVHSTTPETRVRLLKNDRAGLIMEQLRTLLEGGLQVHTQVVLCPGWNDGDDLWRTMEDLYGLGGDVLSLSVVPVGLTRYNLNRPVRLLRPEEGRAALEAVDRIRRKAREDRGTGWCYAADELFLVAERPIPEASYYDGWPLLENGVGSVRSLLDAFRDGVDGLESVPGLRRVRIVTGPSMAPFFEGMLAPLHQALGCPVELVVVENGYFGPTVTVAGLLGGEDIAGALGEGTEGELILLPAEALNDDRIFIDGLPLDALRSRLEPARVEAGFEVVEVLNRVAEDHRS